MGEFIFTCSEHFHMAAEPAGTPRNIRCRAVHNAGTDGRRPREAIRKSDLSRKPATGGTFRFRCATDGKEARRPKKEMAPRVPSALRAQGRGSRTRSSNFSLGRAVRV